MRNLKKQNNGIIIVWFVFLLPIIMFFICLVLDIGYQQAIKHELQNIADAGAYAGSKYLSLNNTIAINTAKDFIKKNSILNHAINEEMITIKLGNWDKNKKTFEANNLNPNSMNITLSYPISSWFGAIFKTKNPILYAQAISYRINNKTTLVS